jgi:hypothetical protein
MKIAFCFLSYGDIEHQNAWTQFFDSDKSSKSDKSAIFLHRADGVSVSTLPGCTVIPPIKTSWGTFSLLQAQQNMFAEAFKDPTVYKCVLLSGDTIPLYKFDVVYNRMCRDDKGYMRQIAPNAQVLATDKKVHMAAWPPEKPWKGNFISQWVVFNRFHVQLLHEHWTMIHNVFKDANIPDEYVYFIFFNGFGCIDTFHNSSPMYVSHSKRISPCKLKHHSVPLTYHRQNFTPQEVDKIYRSGHLFLRKVCPLTTVHMDWSKARPLQDNGGFSLITKRFRKA